MSQDFRDGLKPLAHPDYPDLAHYGQDEDEIWHVLVARDLDSFRVRALCGADFEFRVFVGEVRSIGPMEDLQRKLPPRMARKLMICMPCLSPKK